MYSSFEALNYNCFKIGILDKNWSWQKGLSEYTGWNLFLFEHVA